MSSFLGFLLLHIRRVVFPTGVLILLVCLVVLLIDVGQSPLLSTIGLIGKQSIKHKHQVDHGGKLL